LAGFLAQHRYCGRRSPEALLERLRSAPEGGAGEAEGQAKGELVRALARTLQALVAEIAKLSRCIEHAIAALPDGRIVMSFPRAGTICAAQILAELGDVRARFPSEHQLAAEAGVAPVTYQSAKSRGVGWRWACNKRLRAALTCIADNSRHRSPWAGDVYRRARARGCDHPHAIRILARPGRASSGAPGPTASPTTRVATGVRAPWPSDPHCPSLGPISESMGRRRTTASRIAAGDRRRRREASLMASSGPCHPRQQREVDT
jgi:hypothetical protein